MARAADRLPENVSGDYFVDRTCIDCDLCRQLAPAAFARSARHGQSIVYRQPASEAERRRAAIALVTCPTASIGTAAKADVAGAVDALPERIDGEVYFCGYASEDSYGASSYLIRRPQGNVLVDSPRAARPLLDRLERLGGVSLMFLTHRDDVADHEAFHARFGCRRVLHRDDVSRSTAGVEVQPEGKAPVALADDLLLIPTPGHTRGSAALLHAGRYLFSGDHLWADEDDGRLGAGRGVCWYSWPEQTRSMERLLEHEFSWVLPGHGRRYRAETPAAMRDELRALISRMRAE